MAMKLNTGDSAFSRADFFFVDPFEVEVKEELRGRHLPPTDEAIIDMAISMNDHGQRQPVECRKIENNRIRLNLGFTRTAAARLIREGFKYKDPVTGEEKEIKDEEFNLKVVISDANDQKAFENNIVENAHRNQTSPIDDAHNQHRLRDKYNYSNAQIAALYRYKDEQKVVRFQKLLALPTNVQLLVHTDKMSVQAALDVLDLPEDKRDETIKAATTEDGTVKSGAVRSAVRDEILRDDDKPRPNNGNQGSTSGKPNNGNSGHKARVLSDVRKFLEKEASNQDENIQTFCKNMLLWIQGRRTDKFMKEQLDALLDAERG